MENKPRAYTEEEVRGQFINHLNSLIDYWLEQKSVQTEKQKMQGLVFSILNIFDGNTFALPAIDLVLSPNVSDKEYHIQNDENWYEKGMVINNCQLHELFCKKS